MFKKFNVQLFKHIYFKKKKNFSNICNLIKFFNTSLEQDIFICMVWKRAWGTRTRISRRRKQS